jgi:hypothetical protein
MKCIKLPLKSFEIYHLNILLSYELILSLWRSNAYDESNEGLSMDVTAKDAVECRVNITP